MKRIVVAIAVALTPLWACDKTEESSSAETAESTRAWSAQVAFTEATGDANVQIRKPGADSFSNFAGGEVVIPGSTIRTAANTRARLALDGAELIVNHSTTVKLVADVDRAIEVVDGQVVLQTTGESDSAPSTVILPTGKVVLHGTKVSAVAGKDFSTVSVASGSVEVEHDSQVIEAWAGDEVVLPRDGVPTVKLAPGLGDEFGWSELANPEGDGSIEVPRGLGKLVGKAPGGERERALEMVEHTVDAKIQGNIAYTEITERFRNPTSEVLEGVYRFPLPADAQITRLALDVNGKLMEGQFLETERAEWIWRDIINQSRDPAMLKWKQGNQFELRIFPIEARSVRRVIIGYTQRLEPSAGGYRYLYPMPVDHAATIPAEQFNFNARIAGHDPTQIFQANGYDAKVEHRATEDDEAFTEVTWNQSDFVASGDFSIRYSTPYDENGFDAYRYDSKADDRGFFSVSVRPQFPRAEEVAARDLLLVLDRSYHRTGKALELQKRVISKVMGEMDPLDRVAVIACNGACEPVGPVDFGRATPDRVKTTERALAAVTAQGVSNPVETVRVASKLFGDREKSEREARVVWFADGVASAGELRPGKLRDALGRVAATTDMRTTLVEVGGDVDESNRAAIAAGLGAVHVELDPAMTTTGHALAVLGTTYGDLLTDVEVELPDGAEAVYPRGYKAVAPGDEIVLMGRVKGDLEGDVKLTGKLRGEPWSATYPLRLKTGPSPNSFLPKMWAAERIRDLELADDSEKDTIVGLSKKHGVLSRFTTLLALESEEMMREYGVKNRKYEKWDGTEALGAADNAPQPAMKADGAGPSANEARDDFDGDAELMARERRTKRSRPSSKGKAAKPKADSMAEPMAEPMEQPVLDVFGGGSSSGRGVARRPMRRRSYRRRRPVVDLRLETATQRATEWERGNVDRKRARLANEPGNRTRTMQLIRAMQRANQLGEAKDQIDRWVATNHMDAEALVQLAQWHSLRGEFAEAVEQLTNGVDAQPRGEWVQERAHRAFLATGDDARACAHGVALRALQRRPEFDQDDVLECDMATDMARWSDASASELTAGEASGDTSSDELSAAERKAQIEAEMKQIGMVRDGSNDSNELERSKLPNGQLEVVLECSGDHDLDIMVLEPNGRALSWLSQRRRIHVRNVRARCNEALVIPSIRNNGTYRVVIARTDASSPVSGSVAVEAWGKSKKFPFTMTVGERSKRVAETERSYRWR